MIGKMVVIERRTHIGSETIVGVVTHHFTDEPQEIRVQGTIGQTRIAGLPMPIEEHTAITLIIPVMTTPWSSVTVA